MTRFWAAVPAEGITPMTLLRWNAGRRGSSYLRTRIVPASERGADSLEIAGAGEAVVLESVGPSRLDTLSFEVRRAFETLRRVGGVGLSDPSFHPLFLGGFAFDPDWTPPTEGAWVGFSPARLVLPEWTILRRGSEAHLLGVAPEGLSSEQAATWLRTGLGETLEALRGVQAHRPSATPVVSGLSTSIDARRESGYEQQVRAALDAIAAGDLHKVAVARSEEIQPAVPVEVSSFLQTLGDSFPACYIFSIQPEGADAFIGASPEQLLSCSSGSVRADALAGTAARGVSASEDDALGLELMNSLKERREHDAVVRYLRKALSPVTSKLSSSETPQLLRLANVQHLHTPFHGELRNGEGVLDLAHRVHPTPAVAGLPKAEAMQWLAEQEELDRGWYAGGVGYVAPDGGGTFCVAIRSGLVTRESVHLFAGAGIVEGSEPARESAEVRQKLAGLKEVLLNA
jgi:isochorismate synthase